MANMMKKMIFICLAVLLPTTYAQALTVADELIKCKQVDKSLTRLICYDDLAQKLDKNSTFKKAKNNTEVNPVVSVVPVVPVVPVGSVVTVAHAAPEPVIDYFGKEQTKVSEISTQDIIYATVTEIAKDARKKSIFTLSNEHVWRQVNDSRLRLKIGDTVYVKRGILGAFYLGKDSENQRIKVKRVD
jgi:hypothetical protein